MAYFSSNAPLPQNSLDPPPAWEVAQANARLYANAQASRTGRERVYADLPDVESFWGEGPGLAKDASQIIPASELARQSVLNGLVPFGMSNNGNGNATALGAVGPDGQPIYGQAPQVFSLNAPSGNATGMSPANSDPSMPIAAPVPSPFGYLKAMASGKPGVSKRAPCHQSQDATLPCPNRGVSGYAPPWSDAFAMTVEGSQAQSGGGNRGWIALAILGGGLFALAHAGKGR